MRRLATQLFSVVLIGAAIGAVAGLFVGGIDLRSALDGAFIGGAIGVFFGLRIQMTRRSAAEAGLAIRSGLPDMSREARSKH